MSDDTENTKQSSKLRRGWTTGACATAATKAALTALATGSFPDPVEITLPKGQKTAFALDYEDIQENQAEVGIVKDAGDDPDVTHGALVKAKVRFGARGDGIRFFAGEGVGTITRAGLPLPVGEPAINPVPRQMMTEVVNELASKYDFAPDMDITISVRNGEKLAKHTWNPRLGIVGGLSILGTTGVVIPFSCSAWIHSIHRGIDVARAEKLPHVAGCTGSTSEKAVRQLYELPDFAMLDMGDFVGGMLKYLRTHPVPRITIGGGFAKLSKLAQGHMDLHSGRSQVDFDWMAERIAELGGDDQMQQQARDANTALAVLQMADAAGLDIANKIAQLAKARALDILRNPDAALDIVIVSRKGDIIARAGQDTEPKGHSQDA
ncbi:cobalt-precorrin-5B (C(1))-methyltransferase [uncultured Cohaesibacter sp.]|uniref:cobalt-precorrin-5B (C(1))-methyltransferase n=1 Tax=uncultured Cohaesibacter sp. TaxID=1002546 RepID=UPI00292D698C|nr:cobalt-precorrin-5B (C(1))-methyltransferase [uncultured Cohaesibacter sp.]